MARKRRNRAAPRRQIRGGVREIHKIDYLALLVNVTVQKYSLAIIIKLALLVIFVIGQVAC